MTRWTYACGVALCGTVLAASAQPQYEDSLPLDHPAIQYTQAAPRDPIAALAAQLADGTTRLEVDERHGVLPSLLARLAIPAESQMLVFSKTSFQHSAIDPRHPRAVYYNDDVAVGVVPGTSVIEIAAVDPRQGAIFYTLNGASAPQPVVARRDVCLMCHRGVATLGVPGLLVSSVFPTTSGIPAREGAIVTDHRTPFADRWGGWYVTGVHGEATHRGNAVASNPAEPTRLDTEGDRPVTSLSARFDLRPYLQPSSDLVALMTFEHQSQMTNYLTRLGWEARLASAGDPTAARRVDARVEEVVRYMLFADEAPLTGPIRGTSSFATAFAQRGPRDQRGRSLRDFDLDRRLFRYPLSYMVYSAAFDALPADARERVLQRLHAVLTDRQRDPAWRTLSAADRDAILGILRETKPGLPADW